jgi:metal-responsive CopG/Arc/MetJ family transcriptional regulator
MKQALSTKIDDDLLEIVNEICSSKGITRSEFLVSAIKHYISTSFIKGIPSLEQPDKQSEVYRHKTEEQTESQSQIHFEWGES